MMIISDAFHHNRDLAGLNLGKKAYFVEFAKIYN